LDFNKHRPRRHRPCNVTANRRNRKGRERWISLCLEHLERLSTAPFRPAGRGTALAGDVCARPELMRKPCPSNDEGAGKAGCSARTHGPRATKSTRQNHRCGRSSGLPCAMVLRLIRDLPGDEFLFVTVIPRIEGFAHPVGPPKPPRNLTPATGARTTRLHRPHQCRSSRAPRSLTITSPCDQGLRARHRRVHRIPSQRP
jgi:hypothetical protein